MGRAGQRAQTWVWGLGQVHLGGVRWETAGVRCEGVGIYRINDH